MITYDTSLAPKIVHIYEELLPDELPAKVADRLVLKLSPEERRKTALLCGYESETAGRIMTPDYLSLNKNMSVNEAIEKIRSS